VKSEIRRQKSGLEAWLEPNGSDAQSFIDFADKPVFGRIVLEGSRLRLPGVSISNASKRCKQRPSRFLIEGGLLRNH
jgi:hypothetical protein